MLVASWTRTLKAERKSPDTIRSYMAGVAALAAWCQEQDLPIALDADTVTAWTGAMLEAGRAPATVIARQRGARRFSAWLAEKDLIEADLISRIRPPKLDEPVVPALTEKQLRQLLATCTGKNFHHVRDRALITFMAETTARAAEAIAMELPDLNLDTQVAILRRGKGGKGRLVPFSPQCAERIDDYLRLRRRHQLAKAGSDSRAFGYWGLYNTIRRRGEAAGLGDIHPHQLRHTGAVRWLNKGGSTTGLMAVAGWESVDMLRRYIKASESQLAVDESRRLGLGDL